MKERLFAILIGPAVVALAMLVLPSRSQVKQSDPSESFSIQLERETSRIKAQMEKALAQMEGLRDSVLPAQLARLEARGTELEAELQKHETQWEKKLAEMEAHASEMAALAADEAALASTWASDEDGPGWLGVSIAEVTAEKAKELKLAAERGVLITEVDGESPAAKAGLKANDVVTEFNGQRVEGAIQFRRLVRETPAGREAQLTIWREGRSQNLAVQLGSSRDRIEHAVRVIRPRDFDFHIEVPHIAPGFPFAARPMLGIDAEDLSGQLGAYFGAPDGEGILVREVNAGSPAEKAGLKAGDVITKLDGERVRTVRELRDKLREKREKKSVAVSVVRKGAEVSMNVEIEQTRPDRKRLISRRTAI